MAKALSICIPTYNRSDLLLELLGSLVRDAPPECRERMEICISDNASTDETEAQVRGFAETSPVTVRYSRNPTNLGADQNYLNAVSMASGEYCWLMGSDDGVPPGLIAGIFERLEHCRDILLFDRIVCNHRMEPHHRESWLPSVKEDRYFDFREPASAHGYLRAASGLGGVFSFLSSIIVRRESWLRVQFDPRYLGTAYSHVYNLLHVLMSSGIYYAPTLAVLNRSGNDSFLDQGAVNRVLIDLRGYLMLADDLFPGAHPLRDDFLAIVARERPLLQYGIFLSSHSTAAQWDASRDYLVRLGAWSGGLAFLRTLSPLLGPLYDHFMSIYRRIRYGVRA